ncbi:MAG TPA: glycosyltransferase family 4 protein [Vicinamibacterales bacterium]|nr:glycosyltransferase family 4 protein [Vicinamibacterales bacterium]
MRILIATDAFPPTSGGSGWSTYELARGLRANGHEITIVRTYSERDPQPAPYDGFAVIGFPAFAPPVPFVRNYVRNERLYERLSAALVEIVKNQKMDLIHAQHVLTGPASVMAARRAGIPAVCTVRDYWPVCYWGDVLANPDAGIVCPGCSASAMTRCLRPRTGMAWPATLPAIPYMRANLRHKQAALADADAIVAVSNYVKAALRERGPGLQRARIETIPNGVDVRGVRTEADATTRPMPQPYALFVGKLAKNKGADALVDIAERTRLSMPLVVVGDGPERETIAAHAKATGRDVRVQGWRDRREVFQWLRHAELLIFPSVWPEPLSRVLIEASALSVPIAAVDTGGTADIVVDEETGLLSPSIETLAEDVARLASDTTLRRRLGDAAAARAATRFDVPVIIGRVEALYTDLLTARRTQHAIA